MEFTGNTTNPLKKWYNEFRKKRAEVLKHVIDKSPEGIIKYFTYLNLKKSDPDFCPLFKENIKCHKLKENELICFFCGCPYFDYDLWDEGNKIYGGCKNPMGRGYRNRYGYWDCSECHFPHLKENALKLIHENSNSSTPPINWDIKNTENNGSSEN